MMGIKQKHTNLDSEDIAFEMVEDDEGRGLVDTCQDEGVACVDTRMGVTSGGRNHQTSSDGDDSEMGVARNEGAEDDVVSDGAGDGGEKACLV